MFLKNVETKAQIPNGDFEALLYDGTLSNWGNITLFAVIIDSAGNTIQDSLIFDGPFWVLPQMLIPEIMHWK